MRSYALIFALLVLHARAASITKPQETEKLPNDALDNVDLDNSASEPELVDQGNTVKDVENNLRNAVPVENVPVKVIEEQPVIKTIALREDSNDYVPDINISEDTNIKRVEIDLRNPGPPQRQEHDSQNPTYYLDKERAVATIKQSIEESQNIFNRGLQDVTQKFQSYFTKSEDLSAVQQNIQNLRQTFNAEVTKLSDTIHSYLKPEGTEADAAVPEAAPGLDIVESRLKTLQTNFKSGVDTLSEGVELLSILKEEDIEAISEEIKGKAENENAAASSSTTAASSGNQAGSSTAAPASTNPILDYLQSLQNTVVGAFTNLGNSVQNLLQSNQNQNQNQEQNQNQNPNSTNIFNPGALFQGINFPNFFQGQNQNQGSTQNQQPATPAPGAQSDDAGTTTTSRPNIFQQIQSSFQNLVSTPQNTQQTQTNQGPQFSLPSFTPGPIAQAIQGFGQGLANYILPPGNQQPSPSSEASTANQPSSEAPAQASAAPAEGTNSVPATSAPAPAAEAPGKETAPVQGPIQQIVQNNPIVKGITNAVQRLQGLSNPSTPRDTIKQELDTKGHGGHGSGNNNDSGVEDKKETAKAEVEEKKEIESQEQPAPAEPTNYKTE